MGENFNKIKEGPLTFDDIIGMERYIDPLWDSRINKPDQSASINISALTVKTIPEPQPEVKTQKKSKNKSAKKSAKKKSKK
jgi:hypothetical protein